MNTRWFKLDTLSDVVVSRGSATGGAQESLDCIPGSALLGATIERKGEPFDAGLFFSGRLRVSDALPWVDGRIAWPIPLCFHKHKGEADDKAVSALAEGQRATGEQLREGYLTADGQRVKVATAFGMKSAIDRTRFGGVAEGQLFGYEAIAASQTFAFCLSGCDAPTTDAMAELLVGDLRIGRSRSAEYGRVRIARMRDAPVPPEPQPMGPFTALYCASDVCLHEAGGPALVPAPESFGLPRSAEFDLAQSFIRTRRYSPWNAFHNRRMTERHVICRGSVLTYRHRDEVDPSAVVAALAKGVGLYPEEGLGVVLMNPDFVVRSVRLKGFALAGTPKASMAQAIPNHRLARYMEKANDEKRATPEALALSRAWVAELLRLQRLIGKEGQPVPGASQWGLVRQMAIRSNGGVEDLIKGLNELTQDSRSKWWTYEVRQAGAWVSLHARLLSKVSEKLPDAVRRLALMHAAVAMSRALEGNEEGQR
jgi:CRISPR-associated protein Csx10